MSISLGPARIWIGGEVVAPDYVRQVELGVATPVRPEAKLDDEKPSSFDGWFCIRTDPWPCPGPGCDFVATFQTAAHLVVVWERIDAQTLLVTAERCRRLGRNPRVVEYEDDFGPAIAWEQWVAAGRPVHGLAGRPEGWDGGMRL